MCSKTLEATKHISQSDGYNIIGLKYFLLLPFIYISTLLVIILNNLNRLVDVCGCKLIRLTGWAVQGG